jgi:hypothetical protein
MIQGRARHVDTATVKPRRTTSGTDRGGSASRHDLAVVLGAAVLFALGSLSGGFDVVHDALVNEAPHLAGSALGVLIVASGAGAVIALLQRQRKLDERHRRSQTEAKYQAMIEQVPAVA